MQIKQLAYYVEIINCQSISKAAHNLFISQPSLSQQIQSLEDELGFPLLIRTNRGTEPTELGKLVFRDAKKLISEAEEMQKNWKNEYQLSKTLHGTVRVVTNPSAYPMVSQRSLPNITNAYPGVKCLVMEARRYEILQYLAQGKADLGVSNVISEEQDEFFKKAHGLGVELQLLAEDTFQIAVSVQNPLSDKDCLTTDDLRALPLSIYSGQDAVGAPYYMKYFGQDEIIYVSSIEKMMQLVAGNMAVAVSPERLMCYCNSQEIHGKVRFLNIEGVSLPTMHYIAYKKSVVENNPANKVREIIVRVYQDLKESK